MKTAYAQNEVHLLQPITGQATVAGNSNALSEYISQMFPVFLGAAITLAVVMITWGGIEYIVSRVPGAKVEGKTRIQQALWGLVIALVAWIILNTINPDILKSTLIQ